jgi:hypothetical protein
MLALREPLALACQARLDFERVGAEHDALQTLSSAGAS